MAAFGQTFDSNAWLLRSRTSLIYPRIDVGARVSAGDTVWVNWWLVTWVFIPPPFFDQGRLLRSTWITTPSHSFPKPWPFIQRAAADLGPTVWNNWWFNTPYVPSAKYAFFAGGAIYLYAGQAANLGAQHKYSLVLSGGIYAYQGADSQSDFGIAVDFIPYEEVGVDLSFVGRSIVFAPSTGTYSYQGGPASKFRFLKGNLLGPILTTSMRSIFGPKRVSEEIGAPFDFSNSVLAGDVLSLPQVTVKVWSGVDANPQALWQGSTVVSGNIVYVTLVDGIAGVIYQIEVTVTASVSGILSQMAFLTVLPDSL